MIDLYKIIFVSFSARSQMRAGLCSPGPRWASGSERARERREDQKFEPATDFERSEFHRFAPQHEATCALNGLHPRFPLPFSPYTPAPPHMPAASRLRMVAGRSRYPPNFEPLPKRPTTSGSDEYLEMVEWPIFERGRDSDLRSHAQLAEVPACVR